MLWNERSKLENAVNSMKFLEKPTQNTPHFVATISVQSKQEALNSPQQGVCGSELLRVIHRNGIP